jgi:SNF2 family DNA or RNA helicase
MRTKHPALFMRMRLGKTLVTIRRIKLYRPRGKKLRVLIVAPNSALGGWEDELKLEGEHDVVYLSGNRSQRLRKLKDGHVWNLLNKEGHLAIPEIAHVFWDAVVLDESIFIKNPRAKVTKFYLKNFRKVKHRWVLTGLPNPESSLDYVCQMIFLDNHFMGRENYWEFRKAFFFPNQYTHQWYPHRGVEKTISKRIGKRCFVLRRRDAGLGQEKIYHERLLELPSEVRQTYEKIEFDFVMQLGEEVLRTTIYSLTRFTWLRRLCGGFADDKYVYHGKVDELVSLLTGELKSEQVVVWFSFNDELLVAQAALSKAKISVGHLFGEHPREWRQQVRRDFQEGKYRVLLLQQAIAQMGMDLAAANTAIYYSEPLGYSARAQTEDRILSVNKNEPLLYIHLLVRDSIDIDVRRAMREKNKRSDRRLGEALQEYLIQRRRNR